MMGRDHIVQQNVEMGTWHLHFKVDPDCSILWSQILLKKTIGV